MAEIVLLVGCVATLSSLRYKVFLERQEIENKIQEIEKNIAEYIRLDLEIFEKQKKIKKLKDNEIKELEQKFIYEYPDYSLFSRINLSRKIVEIKYQWHDDDDIKNMSFELNNIRMKLSSIDNMRINNILFEVNNIRRKYKLEQKI
jgi:hypothetical protein